MVVLQCLLSFFFIIPNSLFCGISSKPNLSQQALCTFSRCQFFSLLPNHGPIINVASPRWCHPGRGCDGPLLPWSGSPSPWLARPAVRVCVGGRPASGGTHNSHTWVFSVLSAIKSRNCRSEFRRVAPFFPPPRLQQAGVTDSVRAGAMECAN